MRERQDEWTGGAPTLQEESRAARGRLGELFISVVIVTVLFGAGLNILTSTLITRFNGGSDLLIAGGCFLLGVLLLLLFVPRISTTVSEFHEELEIALPLLITSNDVEVGIVNGYETVTELTHAALARRPAAERAVLAAALAASVEDKPSRAIVARFAVEMAQLIFATRLLRESRLLLGQTAPFRRARAIARAQDGVDQVDLLALMQPEGVAASPNPYLTPTTPGVPHKGPLPRGMRLRLEPLAPPTGKRRQRNIFAEAPLLAVTGGGDSWLGVTAYWEFSDYALPRADQPRIGFMTRCFLRNLSDAPIRAAALAEEQAAIQATAPGHSQADLRAHTEACAKLFDRATRPRILRVFVRMDGAFRVRLLANERRQRGRYIWGAALSRRLTSIDIAAFISALRDEGQRVPSRDR
ncbi:MAG: hypothetical protein KGO05_07645 [Chloroflexota bacterium]|nr:hypothetical protein [Chloroflexota bacterium]